MSTAGQGRERNNRQEQKDRTNQARHWVERGLEWWPRGLARFAVRWDFSSTSPLIEPTRSIGLIVEPGVVASQWKRSIS